MESKTPSCEDAIIDFVDRWNFFEDSRVPVPLSGVKINLEPLYPKEVDAEVEKLDKQKRILKLQVRDEAYLFRPKTERPTIYDAAKSLLALTRLYPREVDGPTRTEVVRILTGAFGIPEEKLDQAAEMLNGIEIKIEEYTDNTGKEDVKYVNLTDNRERRLERLYQH